MEGNFELIIILDGCIHETEIILMRLLADAGPQNLTRSILIKQATPVFETTYDNIGFLSASGPYILKIQADMEMTEYGFNTNLARGIKDYGGIIAISGRCTHVFGSPIGIGKLGELIEEPLNPGIDRNCVHLHGTFNRGLLLIDKRIRSLNQQVLLLKAARPNNGFLTTMNQWKQPAIETMPLQSDWRHTAPSGHQSVHSHRPSQDQSTNAA